MDTCPGYEQTAGALYVGLYHPTHVEVLDVRKKNSRNKNRSAHQKSPSGKTPEVYRKSEGSRNDMSSATAVGSRFRSATTARGCRGSFVTATPSNTRPATPKGKPDNMGLGPYPRVNLKKAREYADQQWLIVHEGKDPRQERAEVKLSQQIARGKAITVRHAFDKYFDDQIGGLEKSTRGNTTAWAENYMLPLIGDWPIQKVDRKTILDGLYVNEKNGGVRDSILWKEKNQTGRQVQNHLDRIFRAAISEGSFAGDNPAKWKGGLDQVLPRRNARNIKHHPSLSRDTVPEIMRVLRTIRYAGRWHELKLGRPVPGCLIEFCALTGAREGEVRQAKWGEFDRDQMIWTVPEHKKNKRGPLRFTRLLKACLPYLTRWRSSSEPINPLTQ